MKEIVGAWRLVSARFEFTDRAPVDLYGPTPMGRVVFTADGWMVALLSGGAGMSGNAEPGAPPFALAYTGRYRVEDGSRLVTAVDASTIPPWVGTEQSRDFRREGETLTLITGNTHPAYPGCTGQGSLTWNLEE